MIRHLVLALPVYTKLFCFIWSQFLTWTSPWRRQKRPPAETYNQKRICE
jgi:hypothetical protein